MKINKLIKVLVAIATLSTATAPVMAVDVVTPTFGSNFVDSMNYSIECIPSILSFVGRQRWLATIAGNGLAVASVAAFGYELYDYMRTVANNNNNKRTNFRNLVVGLLSKGGLGILLYSCYKLGKIEGLAQLVTKTN